MHGLWAGGATRAVKPCARSRPAHPFPALNHHTIIQLRAPAAASEGAAGNKPRGATVDPTAPWVPSHPLLETRSNLFQQPAR